jgi:hypothetical protein
MDGMTPGVLATDPVWATAISTWDALIMVVAQ